MLKKSSFLLTYLIWIIAIFVISLFVEIQGIKLREYWFSIALLLISQYALTYFLIYKLDSSLYYATLIGLCGMTTVIQTFYGYSLYLFYPTYILCFALASFAVFVIFRQNIHFKLFAILLVEAILLIGYKMNYLNIWQVVFINCIYLFVILIRTMFRIRKNLRRVK